MTVAATTTELRSASDYIGLTPEQRYAEISQQFPQWLLTEPIAFPRDDPTYGWACRVQGCESGLGSTTRVLLCVQHAKQFRKLADVDIAEFIRGAEPATAPRLGWALERRPDCPICGTDREIQQLGYCTHHSELLRSALRRGAIESEWRQAQVPLPPIPPCSIVPCVHDGELRVHVGGNEHRICRAHRRQWTEHRKPRKGSKEEADSSQWEDWLAGTSVRESVSQPKTRGLVSLEGLPTSLQQEIRYALHRHRTTPRRTHWRPTDLQAIVDALAAAHVTSLDEDEVISGLARSFPRGSVKRRILLDLPFAARSLMVNDAIAKDAGWFDPIIVGSKPFPGTQGNENRRKPWDLTMVSQRWLRDLLWDHLREEALRPKGKQPSAGTVYNRISGIVLLSAILRRSRSDQGENANLIGVADAKVVKETWDLWYQEKLPIPRMSGDAGRDKPSTLTERNRHTYMSCIRTVLSEGRRRHSTPSTLDPFILSLPEYPRPARNPLPRPLTYDDFQKLVSPENVATLDAVDRENVGLVDIWLTQAFQGGRISETLKLKLGCIGLVGRAQPYLWRDITKTGIVDYGMPCYLPVYERLLLRREATLNRLRDRFANQLASLSHRERAQLEETWDREMPLFPSTTQNPDLKIEVLTTAMENCPWAATKVPTDGHGSCPLVAMKLPNCLVDC